MAAHYAPRLDAYDLQHLGSYTIAACVLHDARQLPAATAATLPAPKPTPGDTAGAIRKRARNDAEQRATVEATIRERYGRIEQPPPGRAQADELPDEPHAPDSDESDVSFQGRDSGWEAQESESGRDGPLDGPFDGPFHGPPCSRRTPHQHKRLREAANPDYDHQVPSGRGRRR